MIRTKKELQYYLEQDRLAIRRIKDKRPHLLGDEIWKYTRALRKWEYYAGRGGLEKILYFYYKYRTHELGLKCGGYSIPMGVFGPGISIAHPGSITVNCSARIGKNCRIHEGVCIGVTNGIEQAAHIGDNVFIGSGAKIIGDITIADDVAIGAGAVVVKSITEPGTTWAGVPAHKISNNNSHSNISPYLNLDEK
ncbi:MAG: serine acetyltransferase [Candidatus Merdivicinus sp.]|jgi:serine O-acetyltransferase